LNNFLLISLVWVAALGVDKVLGEAARWHPLVGFGRLAAGIERQCNRSAPAGVKRLQGLGCWCVLVLPPVIAIAYLDYLLLQLSGALSVGLHIAVLYWAVGWQSLREHIAPIGEALTVGDLDEARRRVGYLVSRDTEGLSAEQILSAGLETTLENSSDALFASLFFYAVAGPAGVVLQRLTNTLDAMWGYRNSRYQYFGWWAARSDDVCNFIPAQLTALGFSLLAGSRWGLRCWIQQGWGWKSINAGSVMASGAAALGVNLGGAASYHGAAVLRPALGHGEAPAIGDLARSVKLVNSQLAIWIGLMMVLGLGAGLYTELGLRL